MKITISSSSHTASSPNSPRRNHQVCMHPLSLITLLHHLICSYLLCSAFFYFFELSLSFFLVHSLLQMVTFIPSYIHHFVFLLSAPSSCWLVWVFCLLCSLFSFVFVLLVMLLCPHPCHFDSLSVFRFHCHHYHHHLFSALLERLSTLPPLMLDKKAGVPALLAENDDPQVRNHNQNKRTSRTGKEERIDEKSTKDGRASLIFLLFFCFFPLFFFCLFSCLASVFKLFAVWPQLYWRFAKTTRCG